MNNRSHLEWRTSVEHNQCCFVRIRMLLSGGSRCRSPRWFREWKVGCSEEAELYFDGTSIE